MTATLLLRFAAPMQSWAGYRVSPVQVPTSQLPTKTGVAGLLGACLGLNDYRSLLDDFELHVRVDRSNPLDVDLQVASAFKSEEHPVAQRAERIRTVSKTRVSRQLTGTPMPGLFLRDFLPHAEFLVALSGESPEVLRWHAAARQPKFMTYLGRRAFSPTFPFVLGVSSLLPADLLALVPQVAAAHESPDHTPQDVRLLPTYLVCHLTHERPEPVWVRPPVVFDRSDYLRWLTRHLGHRAIGSQPLTECDS